MEGAIKIRYREFSAVYLNISDRNGCRKLEGFVWEKQLLSPGHAYYAHHSQH